MQPKQLKSAILFVCCLISYVVNAQQKTFQLNNQYGLQYGFSLKTLIELGFSKKIPNPIIRLSVSGGVASNFLDDHIYPSLNAELQLYNGGLGSRSTRNFFQVQPSFDGLVAVTLTAGTTDNFVKKFQNSLDDRNVPLYYFSDFGKPSLQNPFTYSFSVGTNLLFTTDKGKKDQRVGFINIHFKNFQFSYYNDGGVPVSDIYLGDRADRYYTGGGVISYHLSRSKPINDVQVSFHKFTGYSKSAFEVSNELYLDYMNYHDVSQKNYNKSLWSFTMGSVKEGLEFNYKNYNNLNWDLQHHIHTAIFNAFHLVPYKEYHSISLSKYYSQNHIGIK